MATIRIAVFVLFALAVPVLKAQNEAPQPMNSGLCAATGRSLEKSGIEEPLRQLIEKLSPADEDAKLTIVTLANFGLCQYTFYSPSQRQTFTYADAQGGMHELGRGAPKTEPDALSAFLDLPDAIGVAQQKGMSLPLKSAVLRAAHPADKSLIAVWVLTPVAAAGSRAQTYYVVASDARHAAQIADIRDVTSDYDPQWNHIVDPFHGERSAKLSCLQFHSVGHRQVLGRQSCKMGTLATPGG